MQFYLVQRQTLEARDHVSRRRHSPFAHRANGEVLFKGDCLAFQIREQCYDRARGGTISGATLGLNAELAVACYERLGQRLGIPHRELQDEWVWNMFFVPLED